MDTPKMDTPKMKQEFENVMAFQRSIGRNSGIMLPDELAPMAALCLEYRAQARRLWRAWLKVKPAFDRSRRDVN